MTKTVKELHEYVTRKAQTAASEADVYKASAENMQNPKDAMFFIALYNGCKRECEIWKEVSECTKIMPEYEPEVKTK